jgi:hypothetical protein
MRAAFAGRAYAIAGLAYFKLRRTEGCSSGSQDWLRSSAEISSINKLLCCV